jgi:molecular chaperone GrpE (heat shock protein)
VAKPIPKADEFATAMQQLSAEAEKTLPGFIVADHKQIEPESPAGASPALDGLANHLSNLEQRLSQKIEDITSALAEGKGGDWSARFGKMEEQLVAIRSSETVNQRLFDSLHEELLKYRDNFLHESLQKPFIHDLVHLFDDLTSLSGQLRTTADEQKKGGNVAQWRDNLENAIHSLVEILHRFDVKEIEPKENVDRTLHRVINFEPADFPEEDGQIVMRLKRGFFWRGKLIRPEEVIAKRYS